MEYINAPFRVVKDQEVFHAAFEVGDKVISFEYNPYSFNMDDESSLVIWESKKRYLEEMGLDK